MPIRGEHGAPMFDQKQPHDIEQYFEQLETLFTQCKVEMDTEKKKFAVSFIGSEVADLWKALPEYKDPTTQPKHITTSRTVSLRSTTRLACDTS
jgi:hypothetical protein